MFDIQIKRVIPSQVEDLQKIARKTFAEAFSSSNDQNNMAAYLNHALSLERLSTELEEEDSQFYFATINEIVIGYLKLNFGRAQTDIKDESALEIERIYVLKEFHGKKVAQSLYEKAIEVAMKADLSYIWLGVWEENPRAIRFYKKNGFVAFGKHLFQLGNEEQTDILMKLNLKP